MLTKPLEDRSTEAMNLAAKPRRKLLVAATFQRGDLRWVKCYNLHHGPRNNPSRQRIHSCTHRFPFHLFQAAGLHVIVNAWRTNVAGMTQDDLPSVHSFGVCQGFSSPSPTCSRFRPPCNGLLPSEQRSASGVRRGGGLVVIGGHRLQNAHGGAAFRPPALGAQAVCRRLASETDGVREVAGRGERGFSNNTAYGS